MQYVGIIALPDVIRNIGSSVVVGLLLMLMLSFAPSDLFLTLVVFSSAPKSLRSHVDLMLGSTRRREIHHHDGFDGCCFVSYVDCWLLVLAGRQSVIRCSIYIV